MDSGTVDGGQSANPWKPGVQCVGNAGKSIKASKTLFLVVGVNRRRKSLGGNNTNRQKKLQAQVQQERMEVGLE